MSKDASAQLAQKSKFDADKISAVLLADRWKVARAIAASILGDEDAAIHYLPEADAAINAMLRGE